MYIIYYILVQKNIFQSSYSLAANPFKDILWSANAPY